jgi:hypothetical protein
MDSGGGNTMMIGIGVLLLCMLSSSSAVGGLSRTNTTTLATTSTGSKISIVDLKEFENVPQVFKDIYNTEVLGKIIPALIKKSLSEQPAYTPDVIAKFKVDAAKSADEFVARINDPSTHITNQLKAAAANTTTTSSYMIQPYGY